MKRWVWMKFHATPAVIRWLLGKSDPLTGSAIPAAINERISADTRFDSADRRAVGWGTLYSVRRPEVICNWNIYKGTNTSWQFNDTIIVDHATNTVYVKAAGD